MDAAFGNWLAGFIDGEGCFTIEITNKRRPCLRLNILVRMDDAEIIREIHQRTGIGKLYTRPERWTGGRPQIVWRVQRAQDCAKLATLLDKYPLRAKKKRDFAIWRLALDELLAHRRPSGRARHDDTEYIQRMEGYRDALREIRQYDGEELALPERAIAPQLRLVERG